MPYTGPAIDAADPAITKVVKGMATRLGALDANIFVDRDDSEPIQPGERPAVVVRVVDVNLDVRPEYGSAVQVHSFTVDLDFYVDADMADNITFQHNAMIADAVALLNADWQLGGLVSALDPMSVTGAADAVPAAGVAILTLSGETQTEFGDWTTITV